MLDTTNTLVCIVLVCTVLVQVHTCKYIHQLKDLQDPVLEIIKIG